MEPQEAAGSEILFTAVSYDDPVNLDITQFGDDSFDGMAVVTLVDSTSYDTLWEAGGPVGGELSLTLDGSTIEGSGEFYADGDVFGEAVAGEVVANC